MKRSRISSVGSPIGDGAGDVGGAVDILAARIDQIEAAALELAVGLFARAVVGDGAVGPGRRNGVERQVAKLGTLAAQRLEMVGRGQFVELALGRLLLDPFQEARDRRAVARLGVLLAGDLGRILDRLGQHRRVAQRRGSWPRPSRAPRRSPRPRARDRPRRSCPSTWRGTGRTPTRSCSRTPLPRCWRTSSPIFSPATNRSAVPSALTIA